MSRFKKLALRAINRIRKHIRGKNNLGSRIKKSLTNYVLSPETVEKMKNWRREMKVKALLEQIERKLKQAKDPYEQIELFSALTTIKHLLETRSEMPDNLDELLALDSEILFVMCVKRKGSSTPLLMSDQMLQYAARDEDENMKN
jgi:hypothetical protein